MQERLEFKITLYGRLDVEFDNKRRKNAKNLRILLNNLSYGVNI